MQPKPTIDPAGTIEAIFFQMFYRLFNNEGARRHLGFTHINFYMNQEGMPGWHLWLDGRPGAYQIELSAQSCDIDEGLEDCSLPVLGQFIVRYFPDEAENTFNTFSFFEQMLRVGEMFDQTGTPTVQARQTLHPS